MERHAGARPASGREPRADRGVVSDRARRAPAPAHGRAEGNIRRRPGRLLVTSFGLAIVVGTGLLMIPAASTRGVTVLEALFTATSAVCVTGLGVVDTETGWTGFGQAVILLLIQVGGFGIMTLASTLGLLITRRLGLQTRLLAASATRSVGLGDVRSVLLGVLRVTLVVEVVTAVLLAARFSLGYGEPPLRAAWLGVFHAVSAFNNAGFALWSDNLVRFGQDPWICLPVAVAVIVGSLGFPVVFELARRRGRPSRWSLHTKLTVLMTVVLLVAGTGLMLLAEWRNPATLGPMSVPSKLLAGFFQGVMPRTAGFNSIDVSSMNPGTWLGSDVLMFIGGGSGGTAGGIKVTTVAVLLAVLWSELRGDPDATAFDRRIAPVVQRQALAVASLSLGAVLLAAVTMTITSPFSADEVLYEVVSAFATVGLSTGITADLSPANQLILVALMFAGRLGPITLGTALAMREGQPLFRRPEGAPLVG